MQNELNSSISLSLLFANPYFWFLISAIIIIYLLMLKFNPSKVEVVNLFLELILGLFVYVVSFQWLIDGKTAGEKVFVLIIIGSTIYLALNFFNLI